MGVKYNCFQMFGACDWFCAVGYGGGIAAVNHNLFQETGSTGMRNFLFSLKTSVANCQ